MRRNLEEMNVETRNVSFHIIVLDEDSRIRKFADEYLRAKICVDEELQTKKFGRKIRTKKWDKNLWIKICGRRFADEEMWTKKCEDLRTEIFGRINADEKKQTKIADDER